MELELGKVYAFKNVNYPLSIVFYMRIDTIYQLRYMNNLINDNIVTIV